MPKYGDNPKPPSPSSTKSRPFYERILGRQGPAVNRGQKSQLEALGHKVESVSESLRKSKPPKTSGR